MTVKCDQLISRDGAVDAVKFKIDAIKLKPFEAWWMKHQRVAKQRLLQVIIERCRAIFPSDLHNGRTESTLRDDVWIITRDDGQGHIPHASISTRSFQFASFTRRGSPLQTVLKYSANKSPDYWNTFIRRTRLSRCTGRWFISRPILPRWITNTHSNQIVSPPFLPLYLFRLRFHHNRTGIHQRLNFSSSSSSSSSFIHLFIYLFTNIGFISPSISSSFCQPTGGLGRGLGCRGRC